MFYMICNRRIKDYWPIHLRHNCERTYFSTTTGKDTSLKELYEKYYKGNPTGYEIYTWTEHKEWCKNQRK